MQIFDSQRTDFLILAWRCTRKDEMKYLLNKHFCMELKTGAAPAANRLFKREMKNVKDCNITLKSDLIYHSGCSNDTGWD